MWGNSCAILCQGNEQLTDFFFFFKKHRGCIEHGFLSRGNAALHPNRPRERAFRVHLSAPTTSISEQVILVNNTHLSKIKRGNPLYDTRAGMRRVDNKKRTIAFGAFGIYRVHPSDERQACFTDIVAHVLSRALSKGTQGPDEGEGKRTAVQK